MKLTSTMICAPLTAQSVEQMVSDMRKAKAQGADLVEIRLDCIENFLPHKDLEIILRNKPLPVLIVFRPKRDGGLYESDEHTRFETLNLAKELGADYVDFELKLASVLPGEQKMNHHCGSKIIVSYHVNGENLPKEDLGNIVARIQATGPDIIRLVIDAADITEIARVFHLLSCSQVPLIAYCVGERGLISQILSPKFGGFIVYGSMDGNSLPGLPTLDSLRKAYKVDCINGDTIVFGLISKPVSHSKGPILHNPALRHVKFNGIYVPMFVDDLKKFFNVYSSQDFAGFSVGIPYKEAVVDFCDEVHPLAQSIGAVNTIIRRPSDGKLIGYNTDCEASITAIEDALIDRAKCLACALKGEARPFEELVNFQPEKGAILANATPLGMHPNTDRIPVSEATLGDYQIVFDSVYTPRKTRLLKEAEAAGAITVSGVEMFLRQAIGQFNLFTGGQAPEEFMRQIVFDKF
ncbi:bifunctional 3-dehydroquinate dehydratase/shikimate dehydrogenase, chloroplastic isoform X4 [Ziziphus jujuba]|uniref:Bifunctional 3-dehydroquinate dehydratase/shikimate dehydrogenase, chloroplastic isoform X4 n=1 Tax=Ziziphus jujuba TaxID=326968 RepID=A0ABM3ZTY3_ZIZJJ|nr:bifunctional 3-dehydroquinate dehydratase/shikimate dehydrogenase, chloroplastic isoform X4 [Ziziphus jujuba]